MELSSDLLRPPQREFDFAARRLLCFLYECSNDYDPLSDRGDVERAGYSVAAGQTQLPQLILQVLYVRLAEALQACGGNAVGEPQESRLHIRRKGGNLCGNSFVQDFNPPRLTPSYISFLR